MPPKRKAKQKKPKSKSISNSKKKPKSRPKSRPKSNAKSQVKLFELEKGPTPSKIEIQKITWVINIGPDFKYKTEEDVIKFFNYKLGRKLGEGSFGQVFEAIDMKDNIPTACKICSLGDKIKGSKIESMKNELFIMEKVKHLYVVKLFKHFMTISPSGNRLYLFMELADGGDFSKYCKKTGPIPEDKSRLYFAQIVCGINHIHSLGIAHRDIKLGNILMKKCPTSISKDFLLLITDFGLSHVEHHDSMGNIQLDKTVCGTPVFMAPEILSRKPYNAFLVDIWALGITLIVIITQEFPFIYRDEKAVIAQMEKKEWKLDESKMKNKPSQQLRQFIDGMLEPEPKKRFDITKTTQHPWFCGSYRKAQNEANKKKI